VAEALSFLGSSGPAKQSTMSNAREALAALAALK